MKRYLSIAILLLSIVTQAQQRTGWPAQGTSEPKFEVSYRSDGDTLLYVDGKSLRNVAPDDTADFVLINSDIDQFTPSNPGFEGAFAFGLISDDPSLLLPGDLDTAWFLGATSWFTPAGKADNWLVMGPVSIPSGGADLSWYHRHNRGWTDSYQVFVTTAGPQPYSQIDPDSIIPVFSLAQIIYPDPQPSQDTLWNWETLQLHAFAGERVFIAFRHNAYDGDMLFLDDILIRERDNVGAGENPIADLLVFPNPAGNNVRVILPSGIEVSSIRVLDVSGRILIRQDIPGDTNQSELDLSGVSPGILLLLIETGKGTISRRIIKM